jgi:hypothetical protein
MFNLDSLQMAKQQSLHRNGSGKYTYDQLYQDAIGLLKSYSNSHNGDIHSLKLAAEKLLEAAKIVKRNPEPYLYLSYIFYILGDSKLSQKYLKVSNMIDPGIANIAKLKKILYMESSSNQLKPGQQTTHFNKR